MPAGKVPEGVAPYLAGARLHAARKKDNGLRPISVGNLLRRLAGKCCTARLQERAAAILSPHQLGVGVKSGCEAIVHAARQVLEGDPTLYCLQVDFQNAFNLADRGAAMSEVLEHFPEILARGPGNNLLWAAQPSPLWRQLHFKQAGFSSGRSLGSTALLPCPAASGQPYPRKTARTFPQRLVSGQRHPGGKGGRPQRSCGYLDGGGACPRSHPFNCCHSACL